MENAARRAPTQGSEISEEQGLTEQGRGRRGFVGTLARGGIGITALKLLGASMMGCDNDRGKRAQTPEPPCETLENNLGITIPTEKVKFSSKILPTSEERWTVEFPIEGLTPEILKKCNGLWAIVCGYVTVRENGTTVTRFVTLDQQLITSPNDPGSKDKHTLVTFDLPPNASALQSFFAGVQDQPGKIVAQSDWLKTGSM